MYKYRLWKLVTLKTLGRLLTYPKSSGCWEGEFTVSSKLKTQNALWIWQGFVQVKLRTQVTHNEKILNFRLSKSRKWVSQTQK